MPGAPQPRVPISVVVNTLNEEKNLPFALRSVHPWADEIVVCDMHSDDKTVEIARGFGATVCFHERVGFADPARAYAISQARNEWVLVLDADELVPLPLAEEIRRLVAEDRHGAVRLPRLNYLLGAQVMHLGWGPDQDTQLRLFKKSAVKITPDIHNFFNPHPGVEVHKLPYREGLALVHFNYIDLTQFIEKLNRYALIEARQAFERGERASFVRGVWLASREWLSRYLRHGGTREGWRGLYLTAMMSMYRLAIAGKLTELQTGNDHESVRSRYREEAERFLKAYDGT